MKKILLLFVVNFFLAAELIGQMTPTYDDIFIPMRDGDSLSADVYVPSGPGPFEVILIQTPYNKNYLEWGLPLGVGQNVDALPYAWVVVDWRGFYGSSAADLSNVNRGEDAYDICEWIVAQAWHGDRIGSWGPSALGKIQYDLMTENHPNHTCAVPIVAHPQFAYTDYFYGGVLEKARLETLDFLGYGLSPVVMANVYYSNLWAYTELTTWVPSSIKIPTLQIGGWYDHNIDKMVDWYQATRNSAELSVRDEQWLLVGPWVHGGNGMASVGTAVQGELTYANAADVNNQMALDFFDYYLLNTSNGWENTPMITYYETGKDTWNTSNADQIEATQTNTLYLNENQQLIAGAGTGSSSYISDPQNPSPTIGGQNLHANLDQGPYDQNSLDSRSDVIVFETGILGQDVSISGRVKVNLYLESTQADCDVVVRLCDHYPDDRSMLINDGIQRLRFRNGYLQSDEAFMTPGVIYPVEVSLPFTNYTWKSGHRIKIYISGNSSIRWDVNLQDGGVMYQSGTGNTANISIHHNTSSPSSILLPGANPVLGQNELSQEGIHAFPNPASDVVYLSTSENLGELYIFDASGRMYFADRKASAIDLSTLMPGVYYLRGTHKDHPFSLKVLKD